MLPTGYIVSFKTTAYVSGFEKTLFIISLLFSILVCTDQPAIGPTSELLAYLNKSLASLFSHERRINLSVEKSSEEKLYKVPVQFP